MFRSLPPAMRERMRQLEERDMEDRTDGMPRMQRLCQIPPETGKFIALLASTAPEGRIIEIGTSAGYSTLWLALAAENLGRRITTFEILPEKIQLARETFRIAGVESVIELVVGDACKHIESFE